VISKSNKQLNYEEQIKKYIIINDEVSIDNHILTPSMKISRNTVYKKYADIINDIYGE